MRRNQITEKHWLAFLALLEHVEEVTSVKIDVANLERTVLIKT